MKQQFSKALSFVGFGGGTQRTGPCDGNGLADVGLYLYPIALPGTVRSLVVYSGVARSAPLTVTLLKNNVAQALEAVLDTAATLASDAVNSVTFSAGDTLLYRLVGPSALFPGYQVSIASEFEAAANVYGIAASQGAVVAGAGIVGGAFGNGFWSGYAGNDGSTYSICPIPGAVTTLCLRRYTTPSGGAWVGHIRFNGVIQDGTAGTVNTTCLLDDANVSDFVSVSFTLPCVPTDHVVVVVERLTTTAPFAVNFNVGAGIGFTPTTPGQYMFCGGSNDSVAVPIPGWKWNQSYQEGSDIAMHTAPVGLRGIAITGLYVERSVSPGLGQSYTQTVLRNGLPTSVSCTISDFSQTGQVAAFAAYPAGDLITIQLDATGGAAGTAKFYWGMAAEELPPECPGLITAPRVDGLPYVPPVADACAGTGERGAPRIGA